MKELKVKYILWGLFSVMALSTILVSCEQNALEDLTPTTEELTEVNDRSIRNLSTDIIGTWWHSHEEETNPNAEHIYRPNKFNFPLSRGRNGFKFSPNGDFVYFYPGPADQPMQQTGRWRNFGGQNIQIFFDASLNAPPRPRLARIKVLSIDSSILVIEPLGWQ